MPEAPSRSENVDVQCAHCGESHPAAYTHCPKTGRSLTIGKALIGRLIADRYKVVGLLGEGGMGAVYVAEHTLIGRKVALKRLHPELAADAKAVARFQREARAAAATGHENIVEILDLGFAEDGAPFLVMEYLKGRSLAMTLRREGRLAPARACHIVGQVLAALGAVHRQHIVHRDLKPDNIFLTRRSGRSDYVKVLDFGISKVRREDGEALDLTRTGVLLGTPFYMSPEQARGIKHLDHRVDLYAAGVMLYESLTGRLPFEGQNYHALLQAILAGQPPRASSLVPDLDPRLDEIIMTAIARDPGDRFQTSREMLLSLVPFGAIDHGLDELEVAEAAEHAAELSATTPLSAGALQDHVARSRASERPPAGGIGISATEPVRTPTSSDALGSERIDEDAEISAILERLPRPRRLEGPARRFVATSQDWVGSGVPSELPSFSTPAGLRDAITPYRPESTPRDGGGREASGSIFTGSDPQRRSLAAEVARVTPSFASAGIDRLPSLPPGDAHVKGTLLLSAMEHLEQAHGEQALTKVMASLPPSVRSNLSGVVLPVAWFPLDAYDGLLRGAERVLAGGDGSVALQIGEATAARELPSTHRLFMQSATPAMALARIPQLWRAYHSRGDVIISQVPAGGWRLEVRDLSPDTYLHAMAMCGFYHELLVLAGARDVRVALLSARGRGDERTVTSLRWR